MHRRPLAAAALALVVVLAAAAPARAADLEPCAAATARPPWGSVQVCPVWLPRRGHVPVHAVAGGRASEVGRLTRAGRANWFVCQTDAPGGAPASFRDPDHPAYRNRWWAWTLSDTGAWGWVSQVHFQGGANDERDAGLRVCSVAEAQQTGSASPGPTPPQAPTPPPAPQPPAPPPPAGPVPAPPPGLVLDRSFSCRRGNARETVAVDYALLRRKSHQTGRWVNGAPEIREVDRRQHGVGRITVRVSTCLTRWGWRILAGGAITASSDGITSEGLPRGRNGRERGFGVRVAGGESGALDVMVVRCAKRGTWQETFKTVAGLPWPGPYALSVGLWAAGELVPVPDPAATCSELTRLPIRLRVNRSGRLGATAGDDGSLTASRPGATILERWEVTSTVRGRRHRSTD